MQAWFSHVHKTSISKCDYYDNPLFRGHLTHERRSWLFIHEETWHLCLHFKPDKWPQEVIARPWADKTQAEGWKWRFEWEGGESVDITWQQIEGPRPALPPHGSKWARELTFYVPYDRGPRPKDTRPIHYKTTFGGRPRFWVMRE